jgi:hypothetical protein
MKHLALITTALALTLAMPAGKASAGSCESTCGAARQACQLAETTAFRICRQDARAADTRDARRAAARACRQAFRAAHRVCVDGLGACLGDCHNPPRPGACQRDCYGTARGCVQGALTRGRDCVGACPPGRERQRCRYQCAQQAKSEVDACLADLRACLGGCPASPSGAFLD